MSKNRLKIYIRRFTAAAIVALLGVVTLVPPSNASAGTVTGVYEITNTQGGQCLTVLGGNVAAPAYMTVQGCHGAGYQKFQFERVLIDSNNTAWFEIHPISHVTKCLGLAYDIVRNGIAIQVENCNGGSAQKYTLIVQSTGWDGNVITKIQNKLGLCVQADNPWVSYTYVVQWNCSPLEGGYFTNWQFKWLAQS